MEHWLKRGDETAALVEANRAVRKATDGILAGFARQASETHGAAAE